MSVTSIGIAINRIKAATEKSQIAVFKVYGSDTSVNSVFDSTVLTRSLVGSTDYIGSYHKNMDVDAVIDEIFAAIS